MRVIVLLWLCSLAWVDSSELADDSPLRKASDADTVLSRAAEAVKPNLLQSLQWKKSSGEYAFFYNITDGDSVLAYLNLTKAPILLDLVKIGDKGLVRNEKNDLQIFGKSLLSVVPTITASSAPLGSQKVITAKLAFKDVPEIDKSFSVKTADIDFTIQVGGPSRTDYWNLTSMQLSLTFTVNGSAPETLNVNLTPRFGFTSRKADTACESGYGICAPLQTMWTCRDQVLKQVNLTSSEKGSYSVVTHFYGMRLQPNLGTKPFQWGYFWDCDPVIPLPVWVALIISLGLAFVVWWALAMLSAVHPPTKFDDPKGPGIHIPQTD